MIRMANERQYPKETETQATNSPVPEEFDSAIAPQGYEPELVEEIGKKNGYLLIISNIGVLYAPNQIDITDQIIRKLK